ncbi:MAG: hypothetical protein R6W89_02645 [Candidatus Hydrogenedentota bacterium]
MQKQPRSIALSAPTVTPALWMTLLLFLLATAMMGCEPADDVEGDGNDENGESVGEILPTEEPEEDEDTGENDEDEDSASLRDSGQALPRA